MSVDPLATKFLSWSTYNFVFSNPIVLVDPTGKGPDPFMLARNSFNPILVAAQKAFATLGRIFTFHSHKAASIAYNPNSSNENGVKEGVIEVMPLEVIGIKVEGELYFGDAMDNCSTNLNDYGDLSIDFTFMQEITVEDMEASASVEIGGVSLNVNSNGEASGGISLGPVGFSIDASKSAVTAEATYGTPIANLFMNCTHTSDGKNSA